jgi:hypothetical protein
MKYLLLACSFLLYSCQQSPSEANTVSDEATVEAPPPPTTDSKPAIDTEPVVYTAKDSDNDVFLGSYVGYFEASEYDSNKDISWANLITIFIDSLRNDKIYGHSVVAGNKRPFQGKYQLTEKSRVLLATAKEPGDDRYDGEFELQVRPNENKLSGKWTAFKKLGVSVRTYELEKRSFKYQPDQDLPEEGIWTDLYGTYDEETDLMEIVTPDAAKYNASNQKLTKEMVENMYKGDLEVMRNAIYARHGYSFKNRRMRYVFDNNIDWYMPVSTDIRQQLTPLELENIALIKRYEQHAEAYYDSFGR